MNFQTLRDQAEVHSSDEIRGIVNNAVVNAEDTIYVEKAACSSQFERLVVATIAEQLACNTYSTSTIRWFTTRGIRF